ELRALHPSEEQREAQHRRFSALMARSYKEVQKESVLLSLVRRSVLLYGNTAVVHVSDPGGPPRRMESTMKPLQTSFEFPRLNLLDPVGLDFLLRICKSEELKS